MIHAAGYTTDTFEASIVNNKTLSKVQKFHYLIVSLQNEAKDLISNLQITNENFLVAWQLVTQRYNNKRLIAIHLFVRLDVRCLTIIMRKGKQICDEQVFLTYLLVWQRLLSASIRFLSVHQSEISVEDFHAQHQLQNT